ncbi:MAG TPA: hypothetical protein VN704_12535 [Verrucomicrobiae bacterium]|nr:hypothetical protein [Verrucomicrobiae bacterium]
MTANRSWMSFKTKPVSNTIKYMSFNYCTNWSLYERYLKRDLQEQHSKKRKRFKKEYEVIVSLQTQWHLVVQDESIFVHDLCIKRRKWIARKKRPLGMVTGS